MSYPAGEETKAALFHSPKGQSDLPQGYPPPYPPPQYPQPYNAYAQPCPGYPNPSNPYPSPSPPNAAYYTASQLPYLYPERKIGHTFARIALCLLIAIIVGAASMSVLMWLFFGTDIPRFQVRSFSVPTFDFSNNSSTLRATWEVNYTVKNPNQKLMVSFDHVEISLIYKEFLVDTTLIESFQLNPEESSSIRATFESPSPRHNTTGSLWLNEMDDDKKNGAMVFDLRLFMAATFSSSNVWRRQTTLKVICGDLRVDFEGPSGNGTWNGKRQDCMLLA